MVLRTVLAVIFAISLGGCATTKKSAMKDLEMRVVDLEKRIQEKDDQIQDLEGKLQKVQKKEQAAAMSKAEVAQINKKDIQKALTNAGYYTGPIDGKFGQLTSDAIMEFQKANGLKQDGKVGAQTWSKLSEHLQQ